MVPQALVVMRVTFPGGLLLYNGFRDVQHQYATLFFFLFFHPSTSHRTSFAYYIAQSHREFLTVFFALAHWRAFFFFFFFASSQMLVQDSWQPFDVLLPTLNCPWSPLWRQMHFLELCRKDAFVVPHYLCLLWTLVIGSFFLIISPHLHCQGIQDHYFTSTFLVALVLGYTSTAFHTPRMSEQRPFPVTSHSNWFQLFMCASMRHPFLTHNQPHY